MAHVEATEPAAELWSGDGRRDSQEGIPAYELKDVLDQIVDRIAEVERRHAEALGDIEMRLSALSTNAERARTEMPAAHAVTLERIEERVAALADRVAEARQSREQVGTDAALLQKASNVFRNGDPSEPWDSASADALARLYLGDPVAAAPAALAGEASGMQALSPPTVDFDRAWIEAQLVDIAARVEAALEHVRPSDALGDLAARVEQFEIRFDMAIAGVATRADVEGLRIVEAGISELVTRFEQAESHLTKLDMIESQVRVIAARLEGQAAADTPCAGASLSADDVAALADAAAERAAARVAASVPTEPARFEDLHELLQSYISERRDGDAETATALETVQMALLRLLDRVEAIEVERPPPAQNSIAQWSADTDAASHARSADAIDAQGMPGDSARIAYTVRHEEQTESIDHAPSPAGIAEPARSPASFEHAAEVQSAAASVAAPRDFRAEARRAKQRVDAAGPGAGAPGQASTQSGAAPSRKNSRGIASTSESAGVPMTARPALKIGAVAALVVAAGILIYDTVSKSVPVATDGPAAAHAGPAAAGIHASGAGGAGKSEHRKDNASRTGGRMEPALQPLPEQRPSYGTGTGTEPEPRMRPRSVPETGTDDLSARQRREPSDRDNADPPAQATTRTAIRVPDGFGIAVAEPPRPVRTEEILRAQERQRMATASTRLGAQATGVSPTTVAAVAGGAPAAEAVLAAELATAQSGLRTGSTGPASSSSGHAVNSLEVPAAAVGPLSLRLAAAKGDPSAEFEVAARFAEGKGVKQDFKQALTWYQRAAGRGLAAAQYRLGTLYERGLGTKADPGKARAWYQRAATQGNVKAMHNLAVLSASRDAGTPDYATAAQWFAEAGERGLTDSQFNLGILYENGLGVAKDAKQAYKWIALAARGGDGEAAKMRERLRSRLDAGELTEVDAVVAEWKPRFVDRSVNDAIAAGNAWRGRSGEASAQ